MSAPCSVSVFTSTECGLSSLHPKETDYVKLYDCQRDITSYLKRLGLKCGQRCDFLADVQSEGHLISYRIGLFSLNGLMRVCPMHRDKLGVHWIPPKTCQHPEHIGKMKPFRPVTPKIAQDILCEKGYLIPVGAGVCLNCYKNCQINEISEDVHNEESEESLEVLDQKREHSIEVTTPIPGLSCNIRKRRKVSYSFHSEESSRENSQTLSQGSNWSSGSECIEHVEAEDCSLEDVNERLKILTGGQMSPLRSQLHLNWSDTSERTKRYYQRKADEGTSFLCDLIAPRQSKDLKQQISTNFISDLSSNIIETVVKMYEQTSDGNVRCQLLSILAKRMTKPELESLLQKPVTSYLYYKARGMPIESSGLNLETSTPKYRQRMNEEKLQHAMGFFLDPAFTQYVSFGTRELKMDTGEKIVIPDVVRTVCHSQIVNLYTSYCEQSDFLPLSKSSLYKILSTCAASKRTCLQGLDNIASDGSEAYKTLQEIATDLHKEGYIDRQSFDEITEKLSASKNYLRTDYKLHVSSKNKCADHCISWLLSDSSKPEFQEVCDHAHDVNCTCCDLFIDIENFFSAALEKDIRNKDEMTFNVASAVDQIKEWKRHIIRTINQDQSRIDLLQNLESHQALIVMDWAMKFLPRKFREKQSDWFGQRGRNWHATVCIYKDSNSELCHRTFTHVLNSVRQDWFAVASLLENSLTSLHEQLPQITEVYLRSDNAGCYHCAPLWLSIPGISHRTGVNIKNYCYSEAQSGKSYCDAKIAHMRTRMKTYVASGHDIITAEDMKTALDDGKGVVGCQVAVVAIDTSKQTITSHKMKNINSYNEIIFSDTGITVKQSYGIGAGLSFSHNKLGQFSVAQNETGCVLIKNFSQPSTRAGTIQFSQSQRTTNYEFSCTEAGCTLSFDSYKSLEDHVHLGEHQMAMETQTTFDKVRRQWGKYCNSIFVSEKKQLSIQIDENDQNMNLKVPRGWALKQTKTKARFERHVIDYLRSKYQEGELTGRKITPQEVEREMKNIRHENGEKVFRLSECLSSSQIASYFARYGKHSSKENQDNPVINDEDLTSVLSAIEENNLMELLS